MSLINFIDVIGSMTALTNHRFICTDTNKIEEPFKVEEADTVNMPPPPTEKVFCCVPLAIFFIKIMFLLTSFIISLFSYLCWAGMDLLVHIFAKKQ